MNASTVLFVVTAIASGMMVLLIELLSYSTHKKELIWYLISSWWKKRTKNALKGKFPENEMMIVSIERKSNPKLSFNGGALNIEDDEFIYVLNYKDANNEVATINVPLAVYNIFCEKYKVAGSKIAINRVMATIDFQQMMLNGYREEIARHESESLHDIFKKDGEE